MLILSEYKSVLRMQHCLSTYMSRRNVINVIRTNINVINKYKPNDSFALIALYVFKTCNIYTTLVRLEESALVSNHSTIIITNKKVPQFAINHSMIIHTNMLTVYNNYFRKSFKKLFLSISNDLKASKKLKLFRQLCRLFCF